MKNCLPICILLICGFMSVAHADLPCGAWGYVYDHNGNPAGTKLYTIHVERIDESGSSGYYYYNVSSYYNVGCGQGLVAGDWWLYAETNEEGTHYYSDGYIITDWYPHLSLDQHDFHCTRTTPPNKPDEPKK